MRRFPTRLAAVALASATLAAGACTPALAAAPAPGTTPPAAVSSTVSASTLSAGTVSATAPMSSTRLTVSLTNHTGQALTLRSQDKPYGDWDSQFPQTIADGQTITATAHSSNIEGCDLMASYTTADGTRFDIGGYVPVFGSNDTSQAVYGTNTGAYTIDHSIDGGWSPTASFTLRHK